MIHKINLPINHACAALQISRKAYYDWTKRKEKTSAKDMIIRSRIQELCAEFTRYGYRRVAKQLHRDGHIVNSKKVRRIMREDNLLVVRKKFKPRTTQSDHNLPRYANLAKDCIIMRINHVWVVDITYVRLQLEFIYLATIMDLFSRKCIGWSLSRNVDTELTLTALNKAVRLRGEENVNGCIHHSDHGVQYAAQKYVERLAELGILPSMGEKGNSYDNAFAESFFKTLKYEEVYLNEYETFKEAEENIENFIEEVYNKKRLHSSIGYVPPAEFENEHLKTKS